MDVVVALEKAVSIVKIGFMRRFRPRGVSVNVCQILRGNYWRNDSYAVANSAERNYQSEYLS